MTKKSIAQKRRENQQRHEANLVAARQPKSLLERIDGTAAWLARRSRGVRALVAGLIAASITAMLALLVYSLLFRLNPDQLNFGLINAGNLVPVTLFVLTLIGFGLYWVGWRVMIGFDFGAEELKPGRAAALWMLFGLGIVAILVVAALLSLAQALSAP